MKLSREDVFQYKIVPKPSVALSKSSEKGHHNATGHTLASQHALVLRPASFHKLSTVSRLACISSMWFLLLLHKRGFVGD